jgi:hypothetical protein
MVTLLRDHAAFDTRQANMVTQQGDHATPQD